jgi:PAS domain S-box-containing protein
MTDDKVQNRKSILLVEDEVLIAMTEAKDLSNEGYNVITACNGTDAIEKVSDIKNEIDLILMDVDLGKGIDGTKTAQEILKTNDIPVVFLSSHIEKSIVDKTEKITSYGYVVKNSSITVLNASIKMAFKLYEAHKELKKNQKMILESEEKYRTLVENINDVIFKLDENGKFIYISPVIEYLFEYSMEEIVGKNFMDYVHPDDLGKLLESFKHTVKGFSEPSEFRVVDKNGKERYVRSSGRLIEKKEGRKEIIGIMTDITEKKQSEEKLKAAFQQMHDIIEFLPDPTFVIDAEHKVFAWNKSIEQLTGINKSDMIGKGGYEYAVPFYNMKRPILIDLTYLTSDEIEKNYSYIKRIDDILYAETFIADLNDGKGVFLWGAASPLYNTTGEKIGAIEVIRDITERKQVEDALVENINRFRLIWSESPIAIQLFDSDGKLLEANTAYITMFGIINDEELKRFNLDDYPDIKGEVRNKLLRGENVSFTSTYDFDSIARINSFKTDKKGIIFLDIQITPLLTNERITGYLVQLQDITKRIRTEKSLQSSIIKYKTLFESSPMGIIVTDDKGRIVETNQTAKLVLNLKDQAESVSFDPEWNILLPDGSSMAENEYMKLFSLKNGLTVENTVIGIRKNADDTTWISVTSLPLHIDGYGVIITFSVIDKFKQMEDECRQSVREKEIIMKELQHRTKNNIAIVSSLLKLEMDKSKDEHVRSVFQNSILRIQAILSIYEQLKITSSHETIDFKNYVEKTASLLVETYSFDSGRILLKTDIDLIHVEMNLAVPLGLILNEALCNALKYAYPSGRGELQIKLKGNDKSFMLSVSDSGIGMAPDSGSSDGNGLGLQLIKMLSKQIDADFSIESAPGEGTRIDLRIEG